MNDFSIILATDIKLGIGKNGTIPWNCPADMKYFAKVTKNSIVIMGRLTYEDIGWPLKNRRNIVVTSQNLPIEHYNSLSAALDAAYDDTNRNVFVIGGAKLYNEAFRRKDCKYIYHTLIDGDYSCDTFVDDFRAKYEKINDGMFSIYKSKV